MNAKKKVLFILKHRDNYSLMTDAQTLSQSTGLYNSASFVADSLVSNGYETKMVVVNDNNDIDREVTVYKPDVVIIEALWCVPDKFKVLIPLHPTVKWIVRYHSELPFLATEGISMEWLFEYVKYPNVFVSANSKPLQDDFEMLLGIKGFSNKVVYLPNTYPKASTAVKKLDKDSKVLSVSCFGAVRPLKNHLVQAVAAIEAANKLGKKLEFHINATRLEGVNAQAHLKNLKGLFDAFAEEGHVLIEHSWMDHADFIKYIAQNVDVGMQVSFNETFNIVSADHLAAGVPIVVSDEVKYVDDGVFNPSPTDVDEICHAVLMAYTSPWLNVKYHQYRLNNYSKQSARTWKKSIDSLL